MKRVLLMAGGTGGHVMPALAVAETLRARGAEVAWLGTAAGLEAKVAAEAGFAFHKINIKGLRNKGAMRALAMPFLMLRAMLQVARVMLRWRPSAALGMGGFVSGPGGLVAAALRIRLIIHEQNALAGMTNRHLARLADKVLCGYPAAEGLSAAVWAGNPVRADIATAPPQQRAAALRLLVVGGSLGARVFNEEMPALLARLPAEARPQVRHQCGREADVAEIAARYAEAGIAAEVTPFLDDMGASYALCDLVICRAGAMTVAEICAAGVAAIFVPYPFAASDHQTANAEYLARRAAAKCLRQDDFVRGEWLNWLLAWQNDDAELRQMAAAAHGLARPRAAEVIAEICLQDAPAFAFQSPAQAVPAPTQTEAF